MKKKNEKLEERTDEKIPFTDLVEIADFLLKNNFFEFDIKIITEQPLKLSLPFHICVCLWIGWKITFLNPNFS